ncbi:unnamed protein product [marine sediment metagenome]|jgi:hypothetical protein|uniref:Uncharacterized protein n=1 Tax=marine sediment metagenome TaxID=412755 RepID=X0W7S7_9ZZZZ
MSYIVVQDKLTIVKDEIYHLELILNDAYLRKRRILKNDGEQSWYDWLLEWIGY